MPKKATEMSALAISRLTTPGFHFVGGVAGLALQVEPTGGRSWILRATVGTKRRDMGLGGYPDVTLADAREAARVARSKIRAGIDPIEEGREARAALKVAQSNAVKFEDAASKYIAAQEAGWSNAKHKAQWTSSLKAHAYPHIGEMLVSDIDLHHILEVLEPIWRTKTETATRVRSRIESILDWATTKKYREGLNPARWKGHLENLLPAPAKIAKEKHHPALPVKDIAAFVQSLRQQGGTGARALEFGVLTATRSGEIRGALWKEFDLEEKVWEIPAARMKAAREHRIPLSDEAVELVKAMPRIVGNELVFPAPRGGVMSDGTLNAVISRMNEAEGGNRWMDPKLGREVVQHGFRSTFRDWASEMTSYPHDVAEMALAHTVGDKVVAAYLRGDLFEKRRLMMQDWANYVNTPVRDAKVIPMPTKKATA